ncbi:MAG: MurR/RpiR family transcriptional regulator [Oscillospiraceae bacterium]|jgi:DNA-binding MurR/RpiR family transcriptional regulator|nr:MurR/RpiR family transcriptional regulator [Oscillospiraceae bacterium]
MANAGKTPDFECIRSVYASLSKAHRRVADYIFAAYDKAAFQTANEMGKEVGVSESTIVRFALALGFSGYPQMHKFLQDAVRGSLTSIQRMQVGDSRLRPDRILEETLASDAEMLRRTVTLNTSAAFSAAVEAVQKARNIYIQGTRSSAVLANFLALNLGIIRPGVVYVDAYSASQTFEQMFRISPEDMCIAISFPRYSGRTQTLLRFARDRGASALAITDSPNAPIAALADTVLLAACDTVSFVDSLVAPLSLLNALLAAVSRAQENAVLHTLSQLEEIWDTYGVYAPSVNS